ncbi:MAG: hypothetical protein FJ102_04755 [Deltaproteobacteria bacterium]|nr:hypothetical protein [Deltaproteobacteria bacterium]
MILALATLALAETTTIGGDSEYNDNGDMLKLVEVAVTDAAVVTQLDFAVYNYRSDGDIFLVLYVQDGDQFTLVDAVEAQGLPESEVGWASSGAVSWLLEAGNTYAIGAFVGGDWYYFYQDDRTEQPWFGRVTGSYQVEARGASEAFEPDEAEAHYYYMTIESEDADVDGDGFVASTYGGADCDDADAAVGEPTEEIPDDGIDQDCDGSDLVTPGDTDDPADSGDKLDGGGGGGAVDASTCSCDGGATGAGVAALAVAAALLRRRR